MSPPTTAIAERHGRRTAHEGVDLSQLVEALAQKLEDSAVRERWYPGFTATTNPDDLPYYRVTGINSPQEWLEAALVRPPGVRFELSNWPDVEELGSRSDIEELHRPAEETGRTPLATEMRAAAAGAIAGGSVVTGVLLSVQALLADAVRPNPFVAFAVLMGGLAIVLSTTVAIRESHR